MEHTLREIKKGRGQLELLPPGQGEFEVDFEIHFDTELRAVRSGLPPVERTTATVVTIAATDGRFIPDGNYDLEVDGKIIRLGNLGPFGGGWYALSPP